MKSIIAVFVLIVLPFLGTAQSQKPDFCDLLETTFKNDEFTLLLKIDTTSNEPIIIVDEQQLFENCRKMKLHSKYNTFVLSSDKPQNGEVYLDCNYVRKDDNKIFIHFVDWHRNIILIAVFKQKKGKWVIDHFDGGVM